MLIEGFSLHVTPTHDNIEGHPFHTANNVNGIGIRSIDDYQVLHSIREYRRSRRRTYARWSTPSRIFLTCCTTFSDESSGGGSVDDRFAEQVGIGEARTRGDSTEWQYWVIEFHPVFAVRGRRAVGLEVVHARPHPILYDLGIVGGVNPADRGYAALESARLALGDTLRYHSACT